jgi:glycerol uptake facilitator-like aquaporin
MENDLTRRLAAEFLGAFFLLAAVVGSGIMGMALADGNQGLALLANSLATGAVLIVIILIFGPISGAHFNPAVTLAFALRRDLAWSIAVAYVGVQIVGAMLGVWAAHGMFELELAQISQTARTGGAQWLAEAIATFGLVLTILGVLRQEPKAVPYAVGLYIMAAYWFTASTSFANPAVTIARGFTDTFAGIAPAHVAPFIASQLLGAGLATFVCGWMEKEPSPKSTSA